MQNKNYKEYRFKNKYIDDVQRVQWIHYFLKIKSLYLNHYQGMLWLSIEFDKPESCIHL